jgi:hypothetical protein
MQLISKTDNCIIFPDILFRIVFCILASTQVQFVSRNNHLFLQLFYIFAVHYLHQDLCSHLQGEVMPNAQTVSCGFVFHNQFIPNLCFTRLDITCLPSHSRDANTPDVAAWTTPLAYFSIHFFEQMHIHRSLIMVWKSCWVSYLTNFDLLHCELLRTRGKVFSGGIVRGCRVVTPVRAKLNSNCFTCVKGLRHDNLIEELVKRETLFRFTIYCPLFLFDLQRKCQRGTPPGDLCVKRQQLLVSLAMQLNATDGTTSILLDCWVDREYLVRASYQKRPANSLVLVKLDFRSVRPP